MTMPVAVRALGPALAVIGLIAGPVSADHLSRRYPVQAKPSLHLTTDDGQVRIRRGDAAQISIEVETVGWTIGPGGLRLEEHQQGNDVTFELRAPHMHWGFGTRRVSLEVTVPSELDLDVRTGDGDVSVGSLSGRFDLNTGDGNVEVSDLHGELAIETGDGRVSAHRLDGKLQAHSGDGSVEVSGRFDRLEVGTGDGPIEVEALAKSRVSDSWRVSTGDGSLTLRLPGDLRADLDVHTGDGSISSDLEVEVRGTFNRGTLRGHLNGGGSPIVVRTGDGPIRIQKL